MLNLANIIGPISLSLFATLIGLRTYDVITWDWFWIASPLWITFWSLFTLVYVTLKNKSFIG